MDSNSLNHRGFYLILLLFLSVFSLQSRADGTSLVFFLDSSVHQYLRSRSSEPKSLLLSDVGAAISILLGFVPPTLSSASSEKLNEVLMPNPFDRPRAVFMLEVDGVEDMQLGLSPESNVFSRALKSRVSLGQNDVNIQLLDEEEAAWLGGSYVSTTQYPLSGELIVPLANNIQLKLHMSKKADREFTTSLIALIYNVKRAVQMHGDLSGSMLSPAELIKGRFDGVKVLQEQYGTEDIVQQGLELLVTSISKLYDALQTAYTGQIVGVVLVNGSANEESGTMLTVNFNSRPSARWLEETKGMPDSTKIAVAEVLLVRRTLAWITGIILFIATLLGIHFLVTMPLTRDTLLYSNIKLD